MSCCAPPLLPCQVNRSSEPRDPVLVTTDKDKAFVQDLVQLVTDWLAGTMPSSRNLVPNGHVPPAAAAGGQLGTSADEAGPEAVAEDGQQQQWDELMLPALNSYQRLLAYQELSKPQFGVEGHPGFWVKKVRLDETV